MTIVAQVDAGVAQRRATRRRVRYAAQSVLWRTSSLRRVRYCGKVLAASASGVELRVADGAAGFAGLQTCGSVWACPTCSAKVLSGRQNEVGTAVDTWRKSGGQVAMLTFTVRHNARQSAAQVWDAVSAAHKAMLTGQAAQDEKAEYGVEVSRETISDCPAKSCGTDTWHGRRYAEFCKVGTDRVRYVLPWVRVVEVTHGAAGWHVHVHMLMFLGAEVTQAGLQRLYASMWDRWNRGAQGAGLDGGLMVNTAKFFTGDAADTLADYVTKNTYTAGEKAGLEVARGDLKDGRFGNRSAMQLLRDIVLQPDLERVAADVDLWHEYEQASKGRRQMTWAVGARDVLGLGDEQSDEELAATEVGTEDDAVIRFTGTDWRDLVRVPGRRIDLLETAERSVTEACAALDRWGIGYHRVGFRMRSGLLH